MILIVLQMMALLGALGLCLPGGWSLSLLWRLPLYYIGLYLGLVILYLLGLYIWSFFIKPLRPEERERPLERWLVQETCTAALGFVRAKIHVSGLEKLPSQGRFLLVCNHLHVSDPVVLLHCFKKSQLAFVSKRETDRLPVVGKIMGRIRCQPLNRENDREALTTILNCIDILKRDSASIAVFPEGHCSDDGRLQDFRNGAFKIAQRTGVPIVVCTLRGTSRLFRDIYRIRPRHVYMDLVEVVDTTAIHGGTREIGDLVHQIMERSLGDSVG